MRRVRVIDNKRVRGLTMLEILVSMMILGVISVGTVGLVRTIVLAQQHEQESTELFEEGFNAMERMVAGVKTCTFFEIPNGWDWSRSMMAFSGSVNDDKDYYFDDPLFPRIDEDLKRDMNDDGKPGIAGIDDDNDGMIDEGLKEDDDESSWEDEDVFDGWDNDGDGCVDEDVHHDMNSDDDDGWDGMDDDGDGGIDNGFGKDDDDEDDLNNEDTLNETMYIWDWKDSTITEYLPDKSSAVICTRVTHFEVWWYEPDWQYECLVYIEMTIEDEKGESVNYWEFAYPENVVQRLGKRVR